MDGKTSSHRRRWRAGALALVAAFVVPTAGCGFVHVKFGSSNSTSFVPTRAFVQCMRSHGVPSFPQVNGSHSITVRLGTHGAMVRAYNDCKHLLS